EGGGADGRLIPFDDAAYFYGQPPRCAQPAAILHPGARRSTLARDVKMPRAATGKGKQMLLGRRLTCGLVLGSALALGAVCWSSSSIAGGATARGGMTIRLFYVALADNGRSGFRIGCGDSLVPVKRTIPPT